jgi:hypothetical protein
MKISKREIEILFKLISSKLSEDKFEEIDLDKDEYWIIASDEWQDFEGTPNPVVGSLYEDVEFLKKSIDENHIISYSDFDRLAAILRSISENKAPING